MIKAWCFHVIYIHVHTFISTSHWKGSPGPHYYGRKFTPRTEERLKKKKKEFYLSQVYLEFMLVPVWNFVSTGSILVSEISNTRMIPSLLKVISSRLFVTYINQLTWNLYVGCGVEGVVHGHISERGRLVLLDLGKGVAVKCKHNDSV